VPASSPATGVSLLRGKLQLTEVPIIVLDHLSDSQKRAYILADNQLAINAGWDYELLRLELEALQDEDFNLDLIGFEDAELERLLAAQEAAEGLTDEDAVPELPQTPASAAGDLWILGNHKLLVGDTTDLADVVKLMAGEASDLVFSDPPYNVAYQGYTKDRLKIEGDRMSPEEFKHFLDASFRSFRTVVKPGASLYICHSSSWQREFQNAMEAAGFEVRCQIIWGEKTHSRGDSDDTSSGTSHCSMRMWRARKTPGMETNLNRHSGRKRSPRRIGFTQRPSQSSWWMRALLNSSKAG